MGFETETNSYRKPKKSIIEERARKMGEIIPILAHGLVRRLERKGLRGKVRIQAIAGDQWGVGRTPDNTAEEAPNVISYPKKYLAEDKEIVNAKLRHEIGNLNYPIEGGLNELKGWCKKNKISPILLTALVNTVHEASVNYLEMQNSVGGKPEKNFKALYEQEINTGEMAKNIGANQPYKQALDLSLLYLLSKINLCPKEQFETALSKVHPAVSEIFDTQAKSLLDQAVKIVVPSKKVQLIRDYVWPKLSRLVAIKMSADSSFTKSDNESTDETEGKNFGEDATQNDQERESSVEESASEEDSKMGDESDSETGGQEEGGGMGASIGGEGAGGEPGEQMQESLDQMKQMLKDAKNEIEQTGKLSPQTQEIVSQSLDQLSRIQDEAESDEFPRELPDQISEVMQGMSDMIESVEGEMQGRREEDGSNAKPSGGETNDDDFEKIRIKESDGKSTDKEGRAGNETEGEGVTFENPDKKLIEELRNSESIIENKFFQKNEKGTYVEKGISDNLPAINDEQLKDIKKRQERQLRNLESLKERQQTKMKDMYKEMSGLNGQALHLYTEYRESTKNLTDDLTDFFVEKFHLDRECVYERGQIRGARLQRDFTKNIVGMKNRKVVIDPKSFERKRPPELPQFVWSIIIDNTGSVGEMIEDEKKLAISLIEVTKRLNIPFEIVVYKEDGYMFLKNFNQEAYGDDLKKCVALKANIDDQQDTDLLNATFSSQIRYADRFKRSHNFIFFLTDGLACSADSLREMVERFKKDSVIVGIGLAQGAKSIEKEFGSNSLGVSDSKQLAQKFIRKLEDLIDQTFD